MIVIILSIHLPRDDNGTGDIIQPQNGMCNA